MGFERMNPVGKSLLFMCLPGWSCLITTFWHVLSAPRWSGPLARGGHTPAVMGGAGYSVVKDRSAVGPCRRSQRALGLFPGWTRFGGESRELL